MDPPPHPPTDELELQTVAYYSGKLDLPPCVKRWSKSAGGLAPL